MSNVINFPKKPHDFLVGIIAGTDFDTQLGVNYLLKAGINAIPYPISKTPEEQTKLQVNKNQLAAIVNKAIRSLRIKGVSCIFIYCNSLSGALDIKQLQEDFNLPIITPLEVYQRIAKQFNRFAVIAANCQSVANIERILLTNNLESIVIGLGNLALVNAIEKAPSAISIIKHYRLVEQCQFFESQNCQKVILGCTHFTYFFEELVQALKHEKCHLDIIEPSQNMLQRVLELKYSQATYSLGA